MRLHLSRHISMRRSVRAVQPYAGQNAAERDTAPLSGEQYADRIDVGGHVDTGAPLPHAQSDSQTGSPRRRRLVGQAARPSGDPGDLRSLSARRTRFAAPVGIIEKSRINTVMPLTLAH